MFFIINILALSSFFQVSILEKNLKKYSNIALGAVSSVGRALPF